MFVLRNKIGLLLNEIVFPNWQLAWYISVLTNCTMEIAYPDGERIDNGTNVNKEEFD